jgi:hypothetical protein
VEGRVIEDVVRTLVNGKSRVLQPGNTQQYRLDSYHDDFIRQASEEIAAVALSSSWEIFYEHPRHESVTISNDTIKHLILAGRSISDRHQSMPFKLTLQYKGGYRSEQDYKSASYMQVRKRVAECFTDWAIIFRSHIVNDMEKKSISLGQFRELREETQRLFKEFMTMVNERHSVMLHHLFAPR